MEQVFVVAEAKKKQDLDDSGRWMPIEGFPKSRIFVRHPQNPDFRRAVEQGERRFRRMNNIKPKTDLTNEQWETILSEAAPGNLVSAWDNVQLEAGEDFSYSVENCKRLMALRFIFEQVWRFARGMDETDAEFREEALGKS